MRLSILARMLVTAGVSAWLGMSPSAAERPNFSGRWIGAGSAVSFTIEQNDSTVTITYPPGVVEGRRLVFNLDGSETRNTTRTVTGETWTHVSRARWVTSALLIVTTTTRENIGSWDWMAIYSFTADSNRNLSVTTVDAALSSADVMATETRIYRRMTE